jgi:hypothetical protein
MGDVKRQRTARHDTKFCANPLAQALGVYLIELAKETGANRFHCTQVMPANPYHTMDDERVHKWSQFTHGEEAAACFPEDIVYDKLSGWFTVTPK